MTHPKFIHTVTEPPHHVGMMQQFRSFAVVFAGP